MLEERIKNQKRLTDQMLSAYSVLRDRYQRRVTWLGLGLLASAVVLNALTFISTETLGSFGIDSERAEFLIRCASVTVFFLSLVELRIDWAGKARLYSNAAEQLAVLKGEFSSLEITQDRCDTTKLIEASQRYQSTMTLLPRIPEKQFLPLKASHKRKIEVSRRLDTNPGRPMWLIRLDILWEGLWKKD
jgi:hypothetical protein